MRSRLGGGLVATRVPWSWNEGGFEPVISRGGEVWPYLTLLARRGPRWPVGKKALDTLASRGAFGLWRRKPTILCK